jgi:hypothetical protein
MFLKSNSQALEEKFMMDRHLEKFERKAPSAAPRIKDLLAQSVHVTVPVNRAQSGRKAAKMSKSKGASSEGSSSKAVVKSSLKSSKKSSKSQKKVKGAGGTSSEHQKQRSQQVQEAKTDTKLLAMQRRILERMGR